MDDDSWVDVLCCGSADDEADVDDDDWPYVRSVRVHLAMRTEEGGAAIGPVAVFSATMRCGALDIC